MEPSKSCPNFPAMDSHQRLPHKFSTNIRKNRSTLSGNTPYLLVEEVQGIGFKMADQLAERLGIASDAPERLRAALIHCLLEASMEEGDTYIGQSFARTNYHPLESARQIELDPALVAKELTNLIQEDKVQNVETKIFDNTLYFAEQIYT